MADFRKLLLALIAGALLFGTVAGAADFSCQMAAVPTWVRSEATADFVGDVLLDCGGVVPALTAQSGLTADITLSFLGQSNVLVTSRVLDSTRKITEATLVINDAVWPNGDRHPKGYQSLNSGSTMPTMFQDGSQNIYQGVLDSLTTPKEITWQGVVLIGPGSVSVNGTASRYIKLTNVRVNAQGTPLNGDIVARVHITSPTFVPIFGNNPSTVATVKQGLFIDYKSVQLSNCDLLPNGTFTYKPTFTEGWGSAFKPVINTTIQTGNPHYVLGGGYFDESGYNPVGFPTGVTGGAGPNGSVNSGGALDVNSALVSLGSIVLATQGTRLQLVITDIPSGVTLSSTNIAAVDGLSLTLLAGPWQVGTTATFIWEVNSYDTVAAQSIVNVVTPTITGNYGAPPVTGIAKAHGRFVPDDLAAGPPVPRFVDSLPTAPTAVITINQSCKTLMLFPYLTSSGGYDSGIAITNTSVDPFGRTAAASPATEVIFPVPVDATKTAAAIPGYAATKPQAGACTLYFYGQDSTTNPGTALTLAQKEQTTKDIPAGGQFITLLSAGANGTIYDLAGGQTAACNQTTCGTLNNFVGYMIAACNFQWAHGYAFVTDKFSSRTNGYLALVIPDRGTALNPGQGRLPQDDSLSNTTAFGYNQGEQLSN